MVANYKIEINMAANSRQTQSRYLGCMPRERGRGTFCYLPGRHLMRDEIFGAGAVCSVQSSEHLDTLLLIAEPVRSVGKAPKEFSYLFNILSRHIPRLHP